MTTVDNSMTVFSSPKAADSLKCEARTRPRSGINNFFTSDTPPKLKIRMYEIIIYPQSKVARLHQ